VRIKKSITSREFNHSSSEILRQVREGDVIPVTYGRDGAVVAYIVPASTLRNHEAVEEIHRAVTSPRSAARDVVMGSTVKIDSTHTLDEMREGERY
jgi:antitoxin (DNA-binding transcriptional repressor) of toxin-antitoxin stability system